MDGDGGEGGTTEDPPAAAVNTRRSATYNSVPLWACPQPLPAAFDTTGLCPLIQLLMARPVLRNCMMSGRHPSSSLASATSDVLTDLLFGRPLPNAAVKSFLKTAKKTPWPPAASSSLGKVLHFLQQHCPPTFCSQTSSDYCGRCNTVCSSHSTHTSHLLLPFTAATALEDVIADTFQDTCGKPQVCPSCKETEPTTTRTVLRTNESVVVCRFLCDG